MFVDWCVDLGLKRSDDYRALIFSGKEEGQKFWFGQTQIRPYDGITEVQHVQINPVHIELLIKS